MVPQRPWPITQVYTHKVNGTQDRMREGSGPYSRQT